MSCYCDVCAAELGRHDSHKEEDVRIPQFVRLECDCLAPPSLSSVLAQVVGEAGIREHDAWESGRVTSSHDTLSSLALAQAAATRGGGPCLCSLHYKDNLQIGRNMNAFFAARKKHWKIKA